MRTHKIQMALTVSLLGLCLMFGTLFLFSPSTPRTVEAQGGGPGVSFTLKFTVPASSGPTIIPSCTATIVNPAPPAAPTCIPNLSQIGHTIIYSYASATGPYSGILLEGSAVPNIAPYQIFAASGNAQQNQFGYFSGNAYFSYYRIVILGTFTSPMTLTYVGYGSQVALNPVGFNNGGPFSVSTYTAIQAFLTPTLITGIQCENPNATPAYLQLTTTASTPALGARLWEGVIPGTSEFLFAGPPLGFFSGTSTFLVTLYAGASTTPAGTTPVTIPLVCSFQTNGTGPYYPFNPQATF